MKASRSWREIWPTRALRRSFPNLPWRSTISSRSLYGEPVAQPQPSLWMSTPKPARCLRNRPPRRSVIPPVQVVPRIVPATSGSSAQVSRYAWSIRLQPISPLAHCRSEASIRRAFSIALALSTYSVPPTVWVVWLGESRPTYFLYVMLVTRPVSWLMWTSDATAWVTMSTLPRLRALASVFPAWYLAWTGQIGTQLVFPWQRSPSLFWVVLTAPRGV